MENEYGLDAHYFKKKLEGIVQDVGIYTPDEMVNDLSRLLMVAADQADMTIEIKFKNLHKPLKGRGK